MQSAASGRWPRGRSFIPFIAFAILALPSRAHASLFHGETLDSLANGISWVVLVIAPIIGIAVFWLVHILPEKIAHKKKHPQTRAIQCLCLLSLCLRRAALADRVALGVLETGAAQAGLRHRRG